MIKVEFDARLDLSDLNHALQRRGLYPGGEVQRFVDHEVILCCDPFVPMDTGTLKNSAPLASLIGQGFIVYDTPYASDMYYNPQYNFQGAPTRGAYWFERAMAEHRDDIIAGAAALAGGTAK